MCPRRSRGTIAEARAADPSRPLAGHVEPHPREEPGDLVFDRLDRIAAEYCERRRLGQEPSIEEYARRHPELAEELRQFLPTLALLDRAGDPVETEAPPATAPGKRVGQYQIVRELGRGGMGVVFEALQAPLGRRVALKVLPVQATLDSQFLERFRREAKAAGKLHHPNIVPVFGGGEADGVHYFAMQYVDGSGLDRVVKLVRNAWDLGPGERLPDTWSRADRLGIVDGLRTGRYDGATRRARRGVGGFTEAERQRYFHEVARIGLQVAEALSYAHANGILHRDVKPSNLLLDAGGHVWVADFGLCKARESADLTLSGDVLGTLRYMAPERLTGLSDVRSDVYGLGISLYELLTLQEVFAHSSPGRLAAAVSRGDLPRPGSVQPGIPADLETIVRKATRPEPHERYATADALAGDLRAFLEGRPISAHPPGLLYYLRLAVRRNAALAGTIGAALFVVLASTVYYVLDLDRARRGAEAAQQEEARQRSRALFRSYVANVAAADSALRAGDVAQARRSLAAAPAELRNWEWRHLESGLDRSTGTIVLDRARVSDVAWDQAVRVVACSSDGRWVAAGAERELVLCAAGGTRISASVRAHPSPITTLAWDPDARWIASTGSWETSAVLWSVPELTELCRLQHRDDVRAVAVSPSGEWIATGTVEGSVCLWDAAPRELAGVLEGHEAEVTWLSFAPSGERLASASLDRTVRLWDVGGRRLDRVLRGHSDIVTCVAWDPTGERVASTSWDGRLVLWEADSGEHVELRTPHSDPVWRVSWSPDGSRLATASEDCSVRLWDALHATPLDAYLGHEGGLMAVAFEVDGEHVVSGSYDMTVKEWSLETPPPVLTLRGHVADVSSAVFHPRKDLLLTAGRDTSVRLWDTQTGEETAVLLGPNGATGIDVSPDGSLLVSGTTTGTVVPWDLESLREGESVPLHSERVIGVAFHPDGRRVASASADGTVVILDLVARRVLFRLDLGGGPVVCVSFSPDGSRLACGTWDGRLQVRNADTGVELFDSRGHTDVVADVCWSPDGERIATASLDRTGKVWDATDGRELLVLGGHAHALTGIVFHPDGTRIATSSRSGALKLWDAGSGLEVATLRGHDSWVNDLAFSPDGRQLASVASDGEVKLWDTIAPVGRTGHVAAARAAGRAVDALVDGLANVTPAEEAIRRVLHEPGLDEREREAALRAVRCRQGSPRGLLESAWETVRARGRDRDDYGTARRRAWCLAVRKDPSDGEYQLALGAAAFRMGDHEDALAALSRALRMSSGSPARTRAATLAFLSMAHARRGRAGSAHADDVEAARRELAELERLAAARSIEDEDVLGLLDEAREVVGD